MFKRILLIVLLLIATTGASNATLIEKDWNSAGDCLLTLDTVTNLEWLDVSITKGETFGTIKTDMEIGGRLEGFRYTTIEEFEFLLSEFNIEPEGMPSTDPLHHSNIVYLTTILGGDVPYSGTMEAGLFGFIHNLPLTYETGSLNAYYDGRSAGGHSEAFYTYDPDIAYPIYGHLVVREVTSVPEPSTVILLLSGISLLGIKFKFFSAGKKNLVV